MAKHKKTPREVWREGYLNGYKWIWAETKYRGLENTLICPECNAMVPMSSTMRSYEYCPKCGLNMREEV